MSEEQKVLATLEEYASAYCAKDLARLMGIFVDGDRISLIGTGGDELCSGRNAIASVFERNFRDATALRFEWGWTDVAVHGDAATVAVALVIHLNVANAQVLVPVRWTVSLVKAGSTWRWVHRHASVAADSQDEGYAYPIEN
ncbi:nuclear transport factor 2 family protein [Lutimaribacter marinistellae]|uniref:Nuclear transport factor 2 family protein n=1 Tax=Lutimaribacter marinistellae TaxID=1820329 RepID=A0ABV7TKC7_9RHOB